MQYVTKAYIQQFVWALAAISSAVTLIAFLFQEEFNHHNFVDGEKFVILVGILLFCLLYACYMTTRKTHISLKINDQFRLTIEKGNVFDKKGIIVIPVNEYFDTHVGDGIISPGSVHGKFIKEVFAGRVGELDRKIEEALAEAGEHPIGQIPNRVNAKSKKYELGTCVEIHENGNVYVFIALTHFDDNNHAFLNRLDYSNVIDKLIEHLKRLQTEQPVYMPLIGSGLARLHRSPQRILNFLVDAFDFKFADYSFPNGIFIEIYDMNQVNLTELEELYRNGIKI